MFNRPDFSNYLAHFTSNRPALVIDKDNPGRAYERMSALERLVSILQVQCITASYLHWARRRKAVCFTECPWSSLLDHARRYSSYGIGFNKPLIFAAGGSPVYYVRPDHWELQEWNENVQAFVTPFWPQYRPRDLRENRYLNGQDVDYSHEREWRVPHDFTFEYRQIEFVIVDTYQDIEAIPVEVRNSIGHNKFLVMDMYRNIERLWPVHRIDP